MSLVFPCQVCNTPLSADESQVGQLVRCPQCMTTLRVPAPEMVGAGAGSGRPSAPPPPVPQVSTPPTSPMSAFGRAPSGKRYGFNCGYCSSRLEATEAQAGQEGQCPTCGKNIVIPILDRYGRLIDPMTGKIIKQDPHPVHAYAAAGDRAPKIIRQTTGNQAIQCPRCNSISPISSNNCKSCGMPFTMEGTTAEASGANNGYCVASLVLGIIGIPTGCLFIPAVLAVIFGIVGMNQINARGVEGGGKGIAIAGIVCGVVGLVVGGIVHLS